MTGYSYFPERIAPFHKPEGLNTFHHGTTVIVGDPQSRARPWEIIKPQRSTNNTRGVCPTHKGGISTCDTNLGGGLENPPQTMLGLTAVKECKHLITTQGQTHTRKSGVIPPTREGRHEGPKRGAH